MVMTRMLALAAGLIVALWSADGFAQSRRDPLETIEQSRARHSADNYQRQQRSGTPLGGYSDPLGDPAPRGTTRPGYNSPQGYNSPNTWIRPRKESSW